MKAALLGLAGVFVAASLASAQYPPYPCMATAPNAYGPGMYHSGPSGMGNGPNYNINLPPQPFNGIMPAPPWVRPPAPPANLVPEFPSHPYARSPRDFFMYPQDRDQ